MDLKKLMEIWPLSLKDRKHNQRFFQTEPHNTSIVYTPEHVVENMLDLLPKEIWSNPDITFLNLFCKDGIFLEKIYWRLFDGLKHKMPDFLERSDHILTKQLYGLSPCWAYADVDELTPSERSFNRELYGTEYLKCYAENSRIMLYGTYRAEHKYAYTRRFNDPYGNIWAMYKNVDGRIRGSVELVQDKGKKTIRDLAEGVDKDMKFDVVIGNPPYNKGMDLDFVNRGFDLCDKYCVMITPAKWQTAADDYQGCASKTIDYKGFREKLVPHMSKVVFFPDATDIFNIGLVDGITYFILDKEIHEKCEVINKSRLQKNFNSREIRSIRNRETLHNIGNEIINYISPYTKFSIEKMKQTNGRYALWINNRLVISGNGHDCKTCLLSNVDGSVLVTGMTEIKDSTIDDKASSSIREKVFSSNEIQECESMESWINTKFTRFFIAVNISKMSGILCDDCFRFVPAPPSGKFDHIYTDEELYKAFNLPQEYIDVIEAVIKER